MPSVVTQNRPLFVDLDGTVWLGDLTQESLFAALQQDWRILYLLPIWLCSGWNYTKEQLSLRSTIDVTHLPYNAAVLEWLQQEKSKQRSIYLITASHIHLARQVAAHLGLFDDVIASTGTVHMKPAAKEALLLERYGKHGFDYAGNSWSDRFVWRSAHTAILVQAPKHARDYVQSIAPEHMEFPCTYSRWRALWHLCRPHQWLKNVLIFSPLILAHQLFDVVAWQQAGLAFVAFSAAASAIYCVNDLLDTTSDRAHSSKKHRPLAAGFVVPVQAMVCSGALLCFVAVILWWLPHQMYAVMCAYLVTSLFYSIIGKRMAMLDVLILAGLYSLRIFAGSVATGVPISSWFLRFAMFFFGSLAFVKRYSELSRLSKEVVHVPGRGYQAADTPVVLGLGVACSVLSLLIFTQYLDSGLRTDLYSHPAWLWITGVALAYWLGRLWLLTQRGELLEDPVIFALTDRVSCILGLICLISILLAT